jgi:hypothetical protein
MDLERRASFDAQKGRSSTFESVHDPFRKMIFIFRDHAPAAFSYCAGSRAA